MIIDFEKTIHFHAEIDDKRLSDEFGNITEDSIISFCENTDEVTDDCWIYNDKVKNITWKKDENDVPHVITGAKYDKLVEERERAEHCYECGGYGDDYTIDENGEMISNCDTCPCNPINCTEIEDDYVEKIDVKDFIEQFKGKVKEFYSNVINIQDIDKFVDKLFKETEFTYLSINKNNRIFLFAKNPSRFIKDNTMWDYMQKWVNEVYSTFMAIGMFSTEIVYEDTLYPFGTTI